MVTGERHLSRNSVMKPLLTQHNHLSSFQMSAPSHADTWSTEVSKRKKIIVIRNTATGPNLILRKGKRKESYGRI